MKCKKCNKEITPKVDTFDGLPIKQWFRYIGSYCEQCQPVKNLRKKEVGQVRVDRQSLFGNPIYLRDHTDAEKRLSVIKRYWKYLRGTVSITSGKETYDPKMVWENLDKLKGKTLACWCHPHMCHAHILSLLANSDDREATIQKLDQFFKEV